MDEIYFRHSSLRNHQRELLNDAHSALSQQMNFLAHAPTGLGKTDAAIGAALTHAIKENLTVFFLTPKISQHRIALDVVRGLEQKYKLGLRAVDMIGRRYACIDDTLAELDHEGFYYSCQKKRKEESCAFYGNAKGYSSVEELKAGSNFQKMLSKYGPARTHTELIDLGIEHYSCPYEWMIKLAAVSNVVIADYFHLMVPGIREIFLSKIKKNLEKSIIIVDEGHNLSKRVRENLSITINSFMMKRVDGETTLLGAGDLGLERLFDKWCRQLLGSKEELLIASGDFAAFIETLKMPKDECISYFEYLGSEYIERTNRRSSCLKFSKFLSQWDSEGSGIVRILRKTPSGYHLSKKFLDPSPATKALNQAYASVVMSGTLLPLDMHRDVLGLDRESSIMKQYDSPFEESRQINIIAENMTTRYSQRTFDNYKIMASMIDKILQASPPNAAVFFPSYKVLNALLPLLTSPNLLVQKEKMATKETAELLRKFSAGSWTLCAVQGGSLAEGVDYCNQEIKTAIIVGVALDEMSLEIKSLIDYYEDKFGKGWEYGYLYPGVTKALQAAGRGMRKESDRVAVVFLDERFKWNNYKNMLGRKNFTITAEPDKYVSEFWGNNYALNGQVRSKKA